MRRKGAKNRTGNEGRGDRSDKTVRKKKGREERMVHDLLLCQRIKDGGEEREEEERERTEREESENATGNGKKGEKEQNGKGEERKMRRYESREDE